MLGARTGYTAGIAADTRLLVRPRPAPPPPPPQAVPCAWCWGQRQLLEPARNGEGLIPVTCPGCLGVGTTWR